MEEKLAGEELGEVHEKDEHNSQFDAEASKNDQMDDAVRDFIALRQRGPKGDSLMARVGFEIAQFKGALRIVLGGWLRTPKALWSIFSYEVHRLYRVWVGLPVNKRWWKFQLPNLNVDVNRDEL
jgi:hypothetical protein